MALVDDIGTLTGESYDATRMSEAATIASNIATGLRKEIYTYADDVAVDAGVAFLAQRILSKGRQQSKNASLENPPTLDNFRQLVTKEIRDMILGGDIDKYQSKIFVTGE